MPQDRYQLADRIGSFLSNPDAVTLTGRRRMGPEQLLDELAEYISYDNSANIIRIKEKKNILDHIRSEIVAGKKNHVLLYVEIKVAESDLILTAFPDVPVYRAKELCHQLPVCFKESLGGRNETCSTH